MSKNDGSLTVKLSGKLDIESSPSILKALRNVIGKRLPSSLVIDLQDINHMDDFGAFILLEIRQMISQKNKEFHLVNVRENVKKILDIVSFDAHTQCLPISRPQEENIFVALGEATLRHGEGAKVMVSFVGSMILALFHVFLHPRQLRWEDTITYMKKAGVDALPIVSLISILLGLILAFMSSMQLQQFGANIYVASLVMFGVVSELGPLMTAIIVSGRSGSAFAAEVGTMQISEEIDALFSMGFDPTRFLVIPRLIATVVTLPILTILSVFYATLGSLFVGVFMLDLTPGSYIMQAFEGLHLASAAWAIVKSMIFAVLITFVGCLRGFQARGGALAIGNAATSAVVSSIFLIVLFDSIIVVIRSYWG